LARGVSPCRRLRHEVEAARRCWPARSALSRRFQDE
jgi:hypothetical protein